MIAIKRNAQQADSLRLKRPHRLRSKRIIPHRGHKKIIGLG
jgi:hypothetical protein